MLQRQSRRDSNQTGSDTDQQARGLGQGQGNAALLERMQGSTEGPFSATVNAALSGAFGQSLGGLSMQTDSVATDSLAADAVTEGSSMTFGGGFSAELADPDAMGTAAHEVAHALAGGGSGQTALDQPGDPGEQAAETAEARFANWVAGGMQGPVPQLTPARSGQAQLHRKSTGPGWSGSPVLQYGMRSEAVKALQAQLNAAGARLPTTGYFGRQTLAAVRDFQRKNGLTVDGVAGSATASAFTKGGGSGAAGWAGRPGLEVGASGTAVESLQTQLNARGAGIDVTGSFDASTLEAVRAVQRAAGLTVDGIAGPATHRALAQVHIDASRSDKHTNDCGVTGAPALKMGMRSPQVTELQKLLNQNGASLPATGYFGPMTRAAVVAFQRARGLEADGVVGTATAQALATCGVEEKDAKPDQKDTDSKTDTATDGPGSDKTGGSGGAGVVGNADPKGVLADPNLHPEVRKMAGGIVRTLQGEGLQPYVFEGYRSFTRQNTLFNKGGVTKVRGGGSFHNYGLAVDIVFYNTRGTGPTWDAPSTSWQKLGKAGKSAGFTEWGGDWGWDMPHLEYHPGHKGSAYSLQSIYYKGGLPAVWQSLGTDLSNIASATTWDGVVSGEIQLRKGIDGQAVKTLQEKLNANGATLKVDGDFGSGTEGAVRAYQQANGLQVTGIVDAATARKLG